MCIQGGLGDTGGARKLQERQVVKERFNLAASWIVCKVNVVAKEPRPDRTATARGGSGAAFFEAGLLCSQEPQPAT